MTTAIVLLMGKADSNLINIAVKSVLVESRKIFFSHTQTTDASRPQA